MTREETINSAEIMLAHAEGKKIEYRARGASTWVEMNGNPNWNWDSYQYRIKPQQVSIPATENEMELIALIGRIVKNKDDNFIDIIQKVTNGTAKALKNNFWFYNPDTKCWEDWGGKMRILNHRYIAAMGYVIDTLLDKIVYYYEDDPELKYHKTRSERVNHSRIMFLIEQSDAPYESDDFISCAKVAQVTL